MNELKGIAGQATFVDAIILGLFISLLLALSIAMGTQPIQAQTAREEAFYANTMLLSAMRWENATYGGFDNSNLSMSVAEAVNLYFCTTFISASDVEAAIGYIMNSTIRPGMDYIFYAEGNSKTLWVWNSQPDVCAKAITLVTFDLKPTCPVANWTAPMLGIWPHWKALPPKSACPAGVSG
ncbi:MAG: hypothetical protein QW548_00800 [Candidatus Aenigmatarchaeota archaeon]